MAELFNTIIVYDVYAYAENAEDARAAAIANIHSGELPASQATALELGKSGVRQAWLNEKPLVGAAVSDEDFASIKGKTTQEVWEMLNIKQPADKKAKTA